MSNNNASLTDTFIKNDKTLSKDITDIDQDTVKMPEVFIVSVFGSRKSFSENSLIDKILTPILESLGRIPERILIPSDGITSIYITEWAKSLQIPYQMFEADFRRCGKSAAIVRDGRLEKECTIAIVFQGARTTRYDLLANRLVRRGKRVFFVTNNEDIEELVLDRDSNMSFI